MLHVLIHMESNPAMTSAAIAEMLETNAVVVRRTLAGLRDGGYVRSERGHGGGWTLAKPLAAITLLDVHRAIGEPTIFSIGLANAASTCLVERAVNAALGQALRDAEELLLERLGDVTLASLASDFAKRKAIHLASHHHAPGARREAKRRSKKKGLAPA